LAEPDRVTRRSAKEALDRALEDALGRNDVESLTMDPKEFGVTTSREEFLAKPRGGFVTTLKPEGGELMFECPTCHEKRATIGKVKQHSARSHKIFLDDDLKPWAAGDSKKEHRSAGGGGALAAA
jgi:hypothetical protein